MIVMSDTFGALPGVQFMHTICRFEAQEVKNPILQMVHDSELKWRSYSHWKPITPSWRKNFARLRNHPFAVKWFRSHFAQCCGIPPEVSRYLRPTRWKPNTASWKPTSQRCKISLLLRSDFTALFVRLRNLADLVFTCKMVLSASRYLWSTLLDIFLQFFVV